MTAWIREGDVYTHGAFTITREEIRFGGLRVAWTVRGPCVEGRSFDTLHAAKRFCESPLRAFDRKVAP